MAKSGTHKSAADAKKAPKKHRPGRQAPDSKDASADAPEDAMSRCVGLCQEQRWREATLLCHRVKVKAKRDGKSGLADTLMAASQKIEYSLRRQMAAALVVAAKELLKKEYLLDVGE